LYHRGRRISGREVDLGEICPRHHTCRAIVYMCVKCDVQTTCVNAMTDPTRGSRRVPSAKTPRVSSIMKRREKRSLSRGVAMFQGSSKFRISRLARQIPDLSRGCRELRGLGARLYTWSIYEEDCGGERRGKEGRGAGGGECAAISRVSLTLYVCTYTSEDCEIPLTGRGSSIVFPMMPAVLLRRRSPVLQQHRTHTRLSHAIRPFSPAARPLRTIICPRISHICFPLFNCPVPRSPRSG